MAATTIQKLAQLRVRPPAPQQAGSAGRARTETP